MTVSRRLIGVIAITAALAFPLGVLASHGFTDVPDSNTFHSDIDAIADAGVTTGCGATTYCPKEFVTREQMAAFLNRLGALGPGKTPVVNATKLDGQDSTDFLGAEDVAADSDLLDGLDSTAFARTDVEREGQSSCASHELVPINSGYEYTMTQNHIYSTTDALSLRCQFHVPNGAELTSFRAAIRDTSATEYVACRLERRPHVGTAIYDYAAVATGQAATPGDVTVSNATGLPEIVDNAEWIYVANCSFVGVGADLGVFSTTLEYTFSGVPFE
jgi:hypothetical protein